MLYFVTIEEFNAVKICNLDRRIRVRIYEELHKKYGRYTQIYWDVIQDKTISEALAAVDISMAFQVVR